MRNDNLANKVFFSISSLLLQIQVTNEKGLSRKGTETQSATYDRHSYIPIESINYIMKFDLAFRVLELTLNNNLPVENFNREIRFI